MTIQDIAKLSGVSVATVSRVVNRKGYVSEQTRQRVEEAIEKHGYRPNEVARSLIRSNSTMIAVIMPSRGNPFFASILDAIEPLAAEDGYSILFFNTMEERVREQAAIAKALEHRVRGILLIASLEDGDADKPVSASDADPGGRLPDDSTARQRSEDSADGEPTGAPPNDSTARLLQETEADGIPVVLVDRNVPGGTFDAVYLDNRDAAWQGMKLLYDAGHRRIGLITCPETARPGHTRMDGYLEFLRTHDLPFDKTLIRDGEFSEHSGYAQCAALFAEETPPTAVFSCCSSATLGCMRYLLEQGMKPGRDVGLVGFDDIALLSMIGYSVTGLDRPTHEMGALAYRILADRISGRIRGDKREELYMNVRILHHGTEGAAAACSAAKVPEHMAMDKLAGMEAGIQPGIQPEIQPEIQPDEDRSGFRNTEAGASGSDRDLTRNTEVGASGSDRQFARNTEPGAACRMQQGE